MENSEHIAFRHKILSDFVKYYSFLTDEEALMVSDMVTEAKKRIAKK